MNIKYIQRVGFLLIILGFFGFFISAVWGNPVSKIIARAHMNSFIKENLNGMSIEINSFGYNLENSGYDALILDNKTKTKYHAAADELGVFYQDILPNYEYPKRIVRFPAAVFFISLGVIGIFICLFLANVDLVRKLINKINMLKD